MAVNESPSRPRIVVFGGTFDPIHNAHITIARYLRDELNARIVLMVPAGRPWLRDASPIASPKDRLRMVELAVSHENKIDVSDVDIVRYGTTYSLDTIRDLRAAYGEENEFILAVGSDAASSLHRWHRYDELAKACTFAIVERPGASATTVIQSMPSSTITVTGPMLDISASEIRETYARGDIEDAANFVPASTHRFIIENRLYR